MYVNMYDIATLTANKAQQAEASSDSSAESSSGYSSQPAASPQVRSTTSIFDSEQEGTYIINENYQIVQNLKCRNK